MSKIDVKVDEEFSWILEKRIWLNNGYPHCWHNKKNTAIHHIVIGKGVNGMEVDHINRNKLDNRRANLRHVTRIENLRNRNNWGKHLRGVFFDKTCPRRKPYKAIRKVNGKNIHLGYYATAEEAHKAWQDYVI